MNRKLNALLGLGLAAAPVQAVTYAIDINTEEANGTGIFSSTATGFSALNVNRSDGTGSATIGGITFSTGSTDGARVRGTIAAPTPNALTSDFIFDDGEGQAVILFFGGAGDLAAGQWQVDLWSLDVPSINATGPQIVGLRTNADAGAIQTTSMEAGDTNSMDPTFSFTFTSDGVSAYDVFVRENNDSNRSRLNAVRLISVPESSSVLLSLLALPLVIRRKR